MDPSLIPFNALIVGPTNSGKSRFVVDQLHGPFRRKFDYIVLICPTVVYNKTYEGTKTLIILDDCAASKDVKGATGELVNLAYSARPIGISVWVVTQKYTAISTDFRQNSAVLVLLHPCSQYDESSF